MIKNNFSRLMGERLQKISELSEKTGISRTTLTNLYYRRCKAISFDVLDKLCTFLNCTVDDIIEYRNDGDDEGVEKYVQMPKTGKEGRGVTNGGN